MGGRKQRSAVDVVMLLQSFAEQHMSKNRVVSCVFSDIMGGFDRLKPSQLIEVLRRKNLPLSFISRVSSFLSNRKISLLFNGQLGSCFPVTGAPQGSPISPLLFLFSISELFSSNPCPDFLEISYVDDIGIAFASSSVKKNIVKIQNYLGTLFQKAESLSIVFEKSKSELIHLSKKRQAFMESAQIDDLVLEPKTSVKWLGIWLQHNLSYKFHVEKGFSLLKEQCRGYSISPPDPRA